MLKLDKQVEALLQKIKEKKALVEEKTKESKKSWLTNCTFPLVSGHKDNIALVKKTKIRLMVGTLIEMKEKHEKVNEALDLNDEFEFDGYSYEDWLSDFKTRLAQVELKEEKEKLERLEETAKSIMLEEQKRNSVLQDIMSQLED